MESFTSTYVRANFSHYVLVPITDPLVRAFLGLSSETLPSDVLPIPTDRARKLVEMFGDAIAGADKITRGLRDCLMATCLCERTAKNAAHRTFTSKVHRTRVGVPGAWLRADLTIPTGASDSKGTLTEVLNAFPKHDEVVYEFDADTSWVHITAGNQYQAWRPLTVPQAQMRDIWASGFDVMTVLKWPDHVTLTALALSAEGCHSAYPEPFDASAVRTFAAVMEPLGEDPDLHAQLRALLPTWGDLDPRLAVAAISAANTPSVGQQA